MAGNPAPFHGALLRQQSVEQVNRAMLDSNLCSPSPVTIDGSHWLPRMVKSPGQRLTQKKHLETIMKKYIGRFAIAALVLARRRRSRRSPSN